jgi:hypothetical protein
MPPANIVRPAIAEAGSISGADTGDDGCRDGGAGMMQNGPIANRQLLEFVSEAEATPATVINTSIKPIFRITVKSSILETRREQVKYYCNRRQSATG